ncbi:MAG: putative transcriptional regulator [Fusobacteria bacterium]|nr:MAG: putative transcriptional regulator [Fusobacteriota bacterium]KAF0228787.1 MAG: putative transcriptional [Fusobacteriota bacterium]
MEELVNKIQKLIDNESIKEAIKMYQLAKTETDYADLGTSRAIEELAMFIKQLSESSGVRKSAMFTNVIIELMKANRGYITSRILQHLGISREYLSQLVKGNLIERVDRGIYALVNTFDDSYFIFQLKYKKVIFSHMNALYFHNLTEEFPSSFTVTVLKTYHVENISKMHNVFSVNEDLFNLGVIEINTPNGNMVRAYDIERCICDIIRSEKRMDFDQVKKSVRAYTRRNDRDMDKLSKYAEKMGIKNKVMRFVSMMYE